MTIENGNLRGLEWLVDEIEVSLRQAFEALDAYLKDSSDEPQIRFCQSYIHQVHGTLKIAECHGALLLAEEMEELVEALLQNSVPNAAEASEVLVQAILKLPTHIRQIVSTGKDQPAALISLLNDLRAVRGKSLLSEGPLFTPDMSSLSDSATSVRSSLLPDNEAFVELVKKLRQMYQMALLGLIRNADRDQNLSYIEKVFTRLYELSKGTAQNQLWRIALAVQEGIAHHSIQLSSAVKSLLRVLDREIRRLQQYGVASLQGEIPVELLKNLLYYVAHSNGETVRIREVTESFRLERALPTGTFSSNTALTPELEPDTVKAIAATLTQELEAAKELATRYQQEGCLEDSLVDELNSVLGRMADTLAFVGQTAMSQPLVEVRGQIRAEISNHGKLDENCLNSIAAQLVDTESLLEGWTSTGSIENQGDQASIELARAHDSLLRETRNGLEKVKECIVEYISSQWDNHFLERSPQMLLEIRGALLMMSLERAAAVLDVARSYIEDQLLTAGAIPDWATLDHLADAITSIEYYLEAHGESSDAESGAILAAAEKSAGVIRGDDTSQPVDSSDDLELLDGQEHLTTEDIDLSSPITEAPQETLGEEQDLAVDAGAEPAPSFEVDDELVDVFVEEATDVLENLAGLMPVWLEDITSKDVLVEIRRGFHTLKGSGRMVGAERIGELAWSVEYLLNRSVDGLTAVTEDITSLVATACDQVSVLLESFKARQVEPDPARVDELIARAELLAKGEEAPPESSPEVSLEEQNPASEDVAEPEFSIELDVEEVDILPSVELATGVAEAGQSIDTVREQPDELEPESRFASEPEAQPAVCDSEPNNEQTDELEDNYLAELPEEDSLESEPLPDVSLQEQSTAEPESAEDSVFEDTVFEDTAIEHTGFAKEPEFDASELEQPELEQAESEETVFEEPGVEKDDDLLEIFTEEACYHLESIADFLAECEREAPIYPPPTSSMQRALHTLKGSSNMAGVQSVAELVGPLEYLVKELFSFQVPTDDDLIKLLQDSLAALGKHLSTIETPDAPALPELPDLLATIEQLRGRLVTPLLMGEEPSSEQESQSPNRRDLLGLMSEGIHRVLDIQEHLADWRNGGSRPELEPVLPELDELSRAASKAGEDSLASLSSRLGDTMEVAGFSTAGQDRELATVIETAYEKLLEMIDCVAVGQELPSAEPHLNELDTWIEQLLLSSPDAEKPDAATAENEIAEPETDSSPQNDEAIEVTDLETSDRDVEDNKAVSAEAPATGVDSKESEESESEASVGVDSEFRSADQESLAISEPASPDARADAEVEEPNVESPELSESDGDHEDAGLTEATETDGPADESPLPVLRVPAPDNLEDVDADILATFLEETDELFESMEQAIDSWQQSPEDPEPAEQLKRVLHTFKGGARMVGLVSLGEFSHNFESWLIESVDRADSDADFFTDLVKWQDQLLKLVDQIRPSDADGSQPDEQLSAPLADTGSEPDATELESRAEPQASTQLVTELRNVIVPTIKHGLTPANDSKVKSGPQEMVKVSANLLDDLVNMVGETSISRGRVEQQINEFSFSLEEMDTTIRRLQDQVRRLGMETEAQVMFRREQLEASSTAEGFDPLEMDRYSQLQQLSRALMESASDLQDLASTLTFKSREAESLLVQQGRINTDLQEGLMRSRMVPFTRLVPRLRRIVRQVSGELNKDVELQLLNVEGEMDRSVLEKMVPAMEHMLRNAIDHGIESSDKRIAAGKPEKGVISIDLSREGGEILIRLKDDGRGLDISAIRKQAISQQLMVEGAPLSDHEIVQFILEPGFSTSDKVSQISGRGVGMDVVNADVRQLGGSIAIRSEAGKGTEFEVRLPFTVSINRALMIEVGEDLYALPLSTIDGLVSLSPSELEHFYRNPDASYEYGGTEYGIRYLGSLLQEGAPPRISAEQSKVPLVLVRSEKRSYAVQVDHLVGSSEIVVKTLGTQFSVVPGLSGATVLGDGRVVVILDLLALLRTQKSLPGKVHWLEDTSVADTAASVQTIMVVDDSVTVRKVTSRFLEREGFNVLTAKDGVDAMRLLRDHDPVVMLLDIEMPRMDGFEVASRLRSMARFQDLPIIMITSRTGAKHRERALSLGVNHYLGKPYREEDLLQAIEELRTVTA